MAGGLIAAFLTTSNLQHFSVNMLQVPFSQAGACPLKKLQTVLPVLQDLTDREQKRPKTIPVLQILTDREHRPRREGSLLKPGFIRRAGERAFKTKTADKAIADGFLCRDP